MLGEVSNCRDAQKWESSVEGLGCVHLRLVGGLHHTIFRALSDALNIVSNGHDLDPLRNSPKLSSSGMAQLLASITPSS